MKSSRITLCSLLLLFCTGVPAQDSNWQPITGTQALQAFMSGPVLTFQLQYWNNVKHPDAFAAEHTIRFSVLPVVSAPWNK